MPEETNMIKIIAGPLPAVPAEDLDYLPTEGEEAQHGTEHSVLTLFSKTPVERLTEQIEALRGQLGSLVRSLSHSFSENTELDEITIGLAVSLDGDIGIASAGAEASIELMFKIKH